ncbi:hypothetical protein LHJ74_17370 [Streptomyces sp. N2-109]|uniref:GFO/IDH/MocA-like oxidoreductase domain-containing protein n=2 Tax=Streptomyces gossypii TaxID=2883101 RepID=A0ABT2JUS4_9ACTN|nr:hypothetical protein [Streptomyces gossypii]
MHAGVTWDLLVHDIDIALRLFDEETPKTVNSATGRHSCQGRTGEDTVEAELEFSGARIAALPASRVSSRPTRRLTISEQNRTIVADLLHPSVTVYARPNQVSEQIECSEYPEPLAAQWDRFTDIIEEKFNARAETGSILPSHATVAAILDSALKPLQNCGPLSS